MFTNRLLYWGCMALILLLVLPGSSLSKDVVVNLMIDFDSPSSPTPEQTNAVFSSIINLTNEIDARGLNATIYTTGDLASTQRLMVTSLGSKANHDLALSGSTKDEKLSSMTYSEQEELLKNAKETIDAAHICGGKVVAVNGFRPQSFDQNNDTYKILNDMGIVYDAGFKAGVLYLPGHENDTMPYHIWNYSLYAVPVSTYNLSGDNVYLSDKFIKEECGLNSSKWYEILIRKFDEAAINGEPAVIIFNNLVSGSGDYLDAYVNFIDYAVSKNAKFVTTQELVEMAKAESNVIVGNMSVLGGGCPDCVKQNDTERQKAYGDLSIGVAVTRNENCTNCDNSSVNSTKNG